MESILDRFRRKGGGPDPDSPYSPMETATDTVLDGPTGPSDYFDWYKGLRLGVTVPWATVSEPYLIAGFKPGSPESLLARKFLTIGMWQATAPINNSKFYLVNLQSEMTALVAAIAECSRERTDEDDQEGEGVSWNGEVFIPEIQENDAIRTPAEFESARRDAWVFGLLPVIDSQEALDGALEQAKFIRGQIADWHRQIKDARRRRCFVDYTDWWQLFCLPDEMRDFNGAKYSAAPSFIKVFMDFCLEFASGRYFANSQAHFARLLEDMDLETINAQRRAREGTRSKGGGSAGPSQ